MKQNTKQEKGKHSNGHSNHDKPYAMFGAGNLTAALWKHGDDRSGWHYQFNIFQVRKDDGQVSQRFSPHDVADLAKLTQTLALAISDNGCLEQELRDDLSCLSACLERVFSERHGEHIRYPKLSAAVVSLLRELLDMDFAMVEPHFRANPYADHVYRRLLLIDRWLDGAISPEAVVLPDAESADTGRTVPGCPLCGKHDDCLNLGEYHWYVCRTHRFRWCVGHSLFTPEVYEDMVTYLDNWEEIRDYRLVEPLSLKPKALSRAV